jgi:hypothetical protein
VGERVPILPRIEYSVTVPVPVGAAFQAFLDLERLLHRGIYDEASWIEGAPWQVGSRLRYVVVQPTRATVSAVVTSASPPRAVSLLNHALGVTAEQNVSFGPDLKGGTSVRITMDFVGKSSELSGSVIRDAITFLTKDALDTMAALCQRPDFSASG